MFMTYLNGAIKITDTSGQVLTIIENNGAFARVVFRTLAKERIMVGVGPEKPFILTCQTKRHFVNIRPNNQF
jgi:hypothetical protein